MRAGSLFCVKWFLKCVVHFEAMQLVRQGVFKILSNIYDSFEKNSKRLSTVNYSHKKLYHASARIGIIHLHVIKIFRKTNISYPLIHVRNRGKVMLVFRKILRGH